MSDEHDPWTPAVEAIWHDLECGSYAADLPLWRKLAAGQGGPILDVGAGTGRVALDLAAHGHEVVALDCDPALLAELDRRAGELPVTTVVADAREFDLDRRFALCLVPMQTVQLLGGPAQRDRFLRSVRRHLLDGGLLAVTIVETVECFEAAEGSLGPLPDIVERDGSVYFSAPTAVRAETDGFVLERRREIVHASGQRQGQDDVVHLDRLDAGALEAEARAAGMSLDGRDEIGATSAHVGSRVVMLRA